MSTPWIFCSTFLPSIGEPIDFLLEGRDEPIHGTFDRGVFHSRWAEYESARVRSWRQALIDPAHEAIAEPGAGIRRHAFASLGALARRLFGHFPRVHALAVPRNRIRHVDPVASGGPATRHADHTGN